jgi:DNA invertase Pin-like site-specific DNA recombinase
MRLSDEQEHKLSQVLAAGNQLDAAREQLRDVVFEALDAGIPQTRVAEASGLGRMTLWRWLNAEESERR